MSTVARQVVVLHIYLAISPVELQRIAGTTLYYICTNATVTVTLTDHVVRFFKVKLCKKKLFFFLAIFRTLSLSGSVGVLRETSLVRQEDI